MNIINVYTLNLVIRRKILLMFFSHLMIKHGEILFIPNLNLILI